MTACEQGYIRNRKPNAKMVKAAVEAAKNADVVLFSEDLTRSANLRDSTVPICICL